MAFSLAESLDSFIKKHDNRQLLTIPITVFVLSILVLAFTFASTGAPVNLGMEFKGGTMIAVTTGESTLSIEAKYSEYPIIDARSAGERVMMRFGPMDNKVQRALEDDITSSYSDVEIKQIGAVYGSALQLQALKAVVISFLGMATVVFLIFRTAVPSIAVVLSALSDITIAAAFMNLAGIQLSLGTVAALLMLIGYSVDSDILLTTRVLKRRGTVEEKVSRAMHTGITMTTTTLAALVVMYLVSTYSYLIFSSLPQISLLSDISIVLIFGLAADIMNTWLLNTAILRWHVEGLSQGRRKA
ncbi:MAG TPA: protein translocase subunit SecF [Methanosarcinaceae archaeon]|nr:protein translocase subunit SecF [Methanosarcinaceae archaeon]